MATQLPHLADVEQLSSSVIRILGDNPGKVLTAADFDDRRDQFTLQGTNTYLLGRGRERLLLDTGEGRPAWPKYLSSVLESHSATVSTCVLSHWHHDHTSGVQDLLKLCPNAKVYQHSPNALSASHAKVYSRFDDTNRAQCAIHDGQIFDVGDGFRLRALHCPGHATDHVALIVEDSPDESEAGCMFTGDNVLGHGTAVFEDLATYLASLELMANKIGKDRRAYPAHGEVIENGEERILFYIRHRQQREEEVLRVLKTGSAEEAVHGGTPSHPGGGPKSWSSMAIVKIIYKDVPENLHQPAERGLLQVLEKLKGEGRVIMVEDGRWKLSEKAAAL